VGLSLAPSWGRGVAAAMVFALSAWGCSARAQGNEQTAAAEKLLEHGDFAKAMPMLLQAANHGDVRAKFVLGVVAEQRLHVLLGEDPERAIGWFQEAALAGNTDAMVRLGEMYRFDKMGGANDRVAAEAWYKRAADKGSLAGVLGEAALENVWGSDNRAVEAMDAWEKKYPVEGRSETPLTQGETNDGLILLTAIVLKYEKLGGVAAEHAVPAVILLAAMGQPVGALPLAGKFAKGDGVPRSPELAERLLTAVGDPSDSLDLDSDVYYAVQKELGDDYLYGRGVTRDVKKALELYESAAEGGNNGASIEAGLMYVQGKVVPFDEDKATDYLTLEPMARVVVPMIRRMPGSQMEEVVKELTVVEKSHFALATRLLAERYERGDGVEKSEWKVGLWYKAAALAGDPIAKAKVSKMRVLPAKVMEPKPEIRPGRPGRGPATAGASHDTGTNAPPPPGSAADTQAANNHDSQQSAMDALIRGNKTGNQIAGAGRRSSEDFPEETVSGQLAKPENSLAPHGNALDMSTAASVEERYPNIEAPEVVHPAQEFAVLVSLTGEQISPETKIVSRQQNAGKLEIPIPAGMTSIELEVNLTAPGMEFVDGSNMAAIELDKGQDSTVAQFHLRVRAGTPAGAPKLMATFWYNHGFIARVERSVEIETGAPAGGAVNAAVAPLGAARPMMARAIAPAKPNTGGIQLDAAMAAPDLTIVESRSGDALHLTFISRYSSPVEDTLPKEAEMRTYLHAKFAAMAQQGRGTTVESTVSAQAREDFAHGFGNELWDRFAPAGLKKLYWQLLDAGVRVRTIQVLSDDPVVPWELMRPARESGKDRQDFLALTTRVARWQMGESAMARPPQTLEVKRMVVVAPRYAGAMALNGAQAEAASLHESEGFEEVRGDYTDVRALAANLPAGIVHFAGHGMVKQADGGAQFAILLEDGDVVPATWKELASASTTHPFYFFNACEVGQAQQAVSALDGWGPALLESGASGYMGALWPVSDKAAGIFAGNFYQRMATNPSMPVAEVVRATRQQTYEQTHDATALAYVLYADPYLEVRR